MKSLLIGNTGQVGWELERLLGPKGTIVAVDYPAVDLRKAEQLKTLVREAHPDVIFNAAAYTAVDKAESEAEVAMAINGEAPKVLAEVAKEIGAGLVHYSTDYVYDGTKAGIYGEEDSPNPRSVYGRSKWLGDQGVMGAGGVYAILRTSWVYGSRGKNFLLRMLELAKEREELRVVDDQVGSPTWCHDLAESSVKAAEQMVAGRFVPGIYHATNSGYTSWYGFAKEIFRQREAMTGLAGPRLVAIPGSEYPQPAVRPQNSRLSTAKFKRQFGKPMQAWEKAVAAVLAEVPAEALR